MPTETKAKAKSKTKSLRYIESVGKRKTSIARVRITPSEKNSYSINGKKLNEYFTVFENLDRVESPLKSCKGQTFSVSVKVSGGGISSQADAIRHGIARAIVKFDEKSKKGLKDLGYLTRDARIKERRKFGLKKARKAGQWSKR